MSFYFILTHAPGDYTIVSINNFSEFPTCCARLRCVVEVNGERIVQTRGQPGELFPDKYDI